MWLSNIYSENGSQNGNRIPMPMGPGPWARAMGPAQGLGHGPMGPASGIHAENVWGSAHAVDVEMI